MKNHKNVRPQLRTMIKSGVLGVLLIASIVSCSRTGDRPLPPQSPPKPKASAIYSPSDVERAVYITTKTPTPQLHYQNGLGLEIPKLVIRT